MTLTVIAAARYAVHDLTEINNEAITEQVLLRQNERLTQDPRHTNYEDSPLPDTPEIRVLTAQVAGTMGAIDARLEPSPFWAHILRPGESTMYHAHSIGNYPGLGLSWVYYACTPERCGDLIFICQINDDRVFHRVTPTVGRLVVFPASMPHMTERHTGEGIRVSVSGNYFLPMQTTTDILTGKATSRVSEFSG